MESFEKDFKIESEQLLCMLTRIESVSNRIPAARVYEKRITPRNGKITFRYEHSILEFNLDMVEGSNLFDSYF